MEVMEDSEWQNEVGFRGEWPMANVSSISQHTINHSETIKMILIEIHSLSQQTYIPEINNWRRIPTKIACPDNKFSDRLINHYTRENENHI